MERSQKSLITPAIIFVLSLLFMMVNPFHSASAALGNGVYSVPYTVIKPDDGSASMADGYLVKPATVTVKDGSYTVKLTIKNSSWITEFKPNGANPAVISTSGDTRTVQFSANITSPVVTKMKVDIDDMNYHHEYTVRLSFNTGGATLISGGEEETKQEEKKETTTTSKTDTSTKEKVSESTSNAASKSTESQSSKQSSTSTTKSTANSESTKTASETSEKTSVVASSENQEKKAEEKDTAVTNEDEKVTKEESEEKEAVKEEETADEEEDAEESKQSSNKESSVEQTASANVEEEEKGIGPVVWSMLAGIIALGLGFGIYRYKVRKQ